MIRIPFYLSPNELTAGVAALATTWRRQSQAGSRRRRGQLDDVIDGILLVLRPERLGHWAYNIATGHAAGTRDLAGEIANLRPGWQVDLGDRPLEMAPGVAAARKGALDTTRASATPLASRWPRGSSAPSPALKPLQHRADNGVTRD
jgi:hypothetical protein